MRNLVKYVGIGLLVMGLAACDNSDSKAPTVGAAAESNTSGQAISLLDGKLSFTLPAGMADQSGKLGTQANNMHVYSTAKGNRRSELPNHTATCGANKHTTPHSTAKNKEEITTACVTLIRAVFNFP